MASETSNKSNDQNRLTRRDFLVAAAATGGASAELTGSFYGHPNSLSKSKGAQEVVHSNGSTPLPQTRGSVSSARLLTAPRDSLPYHVHLTNDRLCLTYRGLIDHAPIELRGAN